MEMEMENDTYRVGANHDVCQLVVLQRLPCHIDRLVRSGLDGVVSRALEVSLVEVFVKRRRLHLLECSALGQSEVITTRSEQHRLTSIPDGMQRYSRSIQAYREFKSQELQELLPSGRSRRENDSFPFQQGEVFQQHD